MTMVLTGTHDGEFDGLPPTGGQIALPIAVFTRIEDDRIIEDREFYDTATMLGQLGLGPAVAENASSRRSEPG
jgi:predicted ester cyclase